MPKILTYNSSSKEDKKAESQNPLKSIFEWFNSQEKFTKFFLIFAILVTIATPVIVSQYLDYRQYADVQVTPTPVPNTGIDSDRDGYSDAVENYIGTNPNKACITDTVNEVDNTKSGRPSKTWPADLNTVVGALPSLNKINVLDITIFKAPIERLNTKIGDASYDKRWDLNADGKINNIDVSKLTPVMNTFCQSDSGGGTHESFSEPVRAAFYYAWYPEQWKNAGRRYIANLGVYDSLDTTVIDKHIDWMKYANIDGGIYSWWGIGHPTNSRFPTYLARAQQKSFKWGIYYELDWKSQRTLEQIRSDMNYLRDNYFSHPGYMYVNNKPAVFVYMPDVPVDTTGCAQIAKWTTIRNEYNLYVSMMDVPQWWTCNTLDSWHTYRPDYYGKAVGIRDTIYSIAISAGYWPAWEAAPRLARDFSKWKEAVSSFALGKPRWELVYFNEFGEGTNIEPSSALCAETDCLDYLKVLNQTP